MTAHRLQSINQSASAAAAETQTLQRENTLGWTLNGSQGSRAPAGTTMLVHGLCTGLFCSFVVVVVVDHLP